MLSPNTTLQDRYIIARQIGKGGMGAVYEAKDKRLGSTVALKQAVVDDSGLHVAFEREARLLAKLRHPVLPKVIDHFTEGEDHFLVMEYIPGDDLGQMLEERGGPFPIGEVLGWADQLLDALDYLHTQEPPVIHRDIKPQNLKVTSKGKIILLDFGLAKGAPRLSLFSEAGSIFGYTPHYAPLEQMTTTDADPRNDLYALAATLYHLFTGMKPPDPAMRATNVMRNQADPLQAIDILNPEVPKTIAAVLHSAMAQSLDERPPSAAAMRKALQDALDDRPTIVLESTIPLASQADKLKTALMYAAEKGYSETVQILINANADVNATDREGKTALMYAAENGHAHIVQMLIDSGATL